MFRQLLAWLKELDELLRGRKTQMEDLARGTSHLPLKPLIGVGVALGVFYGLFMGLFAVMTNPKAGYYVQPLVTAIKTPALFFLTLVITFPSLYVFSALLGVRLGVVDTLRLIVSAVAVNLAVLASFGLITGFFTVSTRSYHFIVLLNVLFFAIGGLIGLGFLMNVLRKIEALQGTSFGEEPPEAEVVEGEAENQGQPDEQNETPAPPKRRDPVLPWPLPPRRTLARRVFRVWVVLYAIVGAQMGWVLRPFIGSPARDLPFALFRPRESSIFVAVFKTLVKLLGG